MRIYEELEQWRHELAYFDDAKPGEKCPTPEGVKRYVEKLYNKIDKLRNNIIKRTVANLALIERNDELEAEIHKLKITAERLKKGLKVI